MTILHDLRESFDAHPETDLSQLRGSKILITGGTGFIGCWLLESLLWFQHAKQIDFDVKVLTRSEEKFKTKWPSLYRRVQKSGQIIFIEGDVLNFKSFQEFTHVIHAASESNSIKNDPFQVYETSVIGTYNVLKAAEQAKAKKFLYLSSGAVYGPNPARWVIEPHTYLPNDFNAYADGKRGAELLCKLKQGGDLSICVARLFSFIGPYMPLNEHYAAGSFIGSFLKDKPIQIKGDPSSIRSYLYASDLMVWIWNLLLKGEGIYNVGSDIIISISELAEMISHRKYDVTISSLNPQYSNYVPCTAKARQEFKLSQVVYLKEAIRRTLEWYKNENKMSLR